LAAIRWNVAGVKILSMSTDGRLSSMRPGRGGVCLTVRLSATFFLKGRRKTKTEDEDDVNVMAHQYLPTTGIYPPRHRWGDEERNCTS